LFIKNNYKIIKSAISKELASFLYEYFFLKRKVAITLFETSYIPPNHIDWGFWNDPQVLNTYSSYGDLAMETLLLKIKPLLEKETQLKLVETYSFARLYKKGDILERHKDRPSCEISTTLNLGGDSWSIFLEPSIEVNLSPGDMLIYRGALLDHWREEFKGNSCGQVFLHYNDASNPNAKKNKYDARPFIGLPHFFKNKTVSNENK